MTKIAILNTKTISSLFGGIRTILSLDEINRNLFGRASASTRKLPKTSTGLFPRLVSSVRARFSINCTVQKQKNILAYSYIEYAIAMPWNPRVFKTYTICEIPLKYSYRIWLNTLCAKSFVHNAFLSIFMYRVKSLKACLYVSRKDI